MKMKTSELTGAALDWAVGDIEFKRLIAQGSVVKQWILEDHAEGLRTDPYSTSWLHAGPLIEKYRLELFDCAYLGADEQWKSAHTPDGLQPGYFFQAYGPTPLIAAMRCFCFAKLGDEIEVPDELCNSLGE